jgi:phosphate:Na+ symporter
VVFSFDLSWLSPLLIFLGVILFIARPSTNAGRFGRVLIGLGLMLLALRLISESTQIMVRSPVVQALLASINRDLLLEITVGAGLALLAYSSLAIVLLVAALAASGIVPVDMALALVLGANLGSGLLGVATTARSAVEVRHVPLGNLVFKAVGVVLAAPFLDLWQRHVRPLAGSDSTTVVLFHLAFNFAMGVLFLWATKPVARFVLDVVPRPTQRPNSRPRHLDPSALETPSLAISCAAREALHQADVVETMLVGILQVIRTNDLRLAEELRKLDDTVDELYSAIKYYLTKISREALGEEESRRWTDIISFTINMEQIGDTIERVLIDIEDKKIRKGRSFSDAGMAEIAELHERLVANLRLGMSVFLNGDVASAQRLLAEKERFRDLERAYHDTHLDRLAGLSPEAIETSSLHLDIISDMRRINSFFCSTAYPILEQAGKLRRSRLMGATGIHKARPDLAPPGSESAPAK